MLKDKFVHIWNNIVYKFKKWFHTKQGYERHFNSHKLFMDFLYLIISIIFSAILYKNIDFFNQYILIFLKVGSLLLLGGIFFIGFYLIRICKQIRNKHHNLSNGYKVIIAIIVIMVLVVILYNPSAMTTKIKKLSDSISLANFNPFVSSKLVSNTNIISPDSISAKLDFRKLTNFLPQPWGFIIFWGIVIAIILGLLAKFVFHGYLPSWFVWTLAIIGIIMLFQFKIPYATVDAASFNVKCNDNNQVVVENSMFGIGEMAAQTSMSLSCLDYKSSQCRPLCNEKKPVCQCEANLLDIVFHQKGDWILGG